MVISEQELNEQLERENLLFDQMLALSERQLFLYSDVDLNEDKLVEAFEALIDERDTLMGLIDGIQTVIKETDADLHHSQLLKRHRQEIEPIITSIQSNDRQMLQLAQEFRKVLGYKLKEARNNKKAYQAYYGEVDTGGKGWFIDRKK
ncbi:MAG: flagellar protein FliT [Deltaproteobacteria bacterium]